MSSEAFVTLATTDDYGLGALVLAESIRQVGTTRDLVVLISNHLSDLIKETLQISFDEVIVVDELNSNDIEHLNLLSRPELGITFTKIHCWLLEQYSKCVFLDADCVVLRSIDDLFQREPFSAAPDAGWPDCFNSGVFVYRPSKQTYNQLMLFASQENPSFDGGDQGLLNGFFSNWRTEDISRHLPFTYNVTSNAFYSYLPAVTRFRNDIHIVHFAGALKPWQLTYNPQNEQLSGNLGGQSDIQRDFLLSWWRVMHQQVWPNINKINQQANANNKSNGGEDQFGNGFIGSLDYANLTDNQGIELGSAAHRRAWEAGHIDYYGRDSFSNIQLQLERNIQQQTQQYHPSQQRQISPEKITTTTKTTTTTTSILKTSLKETTLTPQQITTNVSQTQQPTNGLKSALKETITTPQQTKITVSKNVFQQSQTTNIVKTSLKETTSPSQHQNLQNVVQESPTTNIVQSSLNETTLPSQHQNETTPPSQPTNIVQSSLQETTPPSQHQNLQNVVQEPPTTNIVQSSLQETTPPSQHQNLQNVVQEPPTTNIVQSSLQETTLPSQHQNLQNVVQESPTTNIVQSSLNETTPSQHQHETTPPSQPINIVESSLSETTPPSQHQNLQNVVQEPPTTNIVQSSLQETTLPSQHQNLQNVVQESPTTNIVQSSLNETTPSQHQHETTPPSQPINIVESSLSETTPPSQHQNLQNVVQESPTTNIVKSSLKETTLPPQQTKISVSKNVVQQSQSTNIIKGSLQETTLPSKHQNLPNVFQQSQPTNIVQSSLQETTLPSKHQNLPNVFQQSQSTNIVKSSLNETTLPSKHQNVQNAFQQSQSTNIIKGSLQETTLPSQHQNVQNVFQESQSRNIVKSSLKETTPPSQHQNVQSTIDSNENNNLTCEHESNWTVKSTIVTAYTPGIGDLSGPTVITKVVSESTATSSSDIPIKTSIKQMTDSTNSSELNKTARTSNANFNWLFNKIFVAITYTISLCYLLFLVAIRRSKNTNIIHGTATSIRGVTSSNNNGNRVNK